MKYLVQTIDEEVGVGFGDAHWGFDAQDVAVQAAFADEQAAVFALFEEVGGLSRRPPRKGDTDLATVEDCKRTIRIKALSPGRHEGFLDRLEKAGIPVEREEEPEDEMCCGPENEAAP